MTDEWPPDAELRRREQRRAYHRRRNQRTASGTNQGRSWPISDARTAIDPQYTVPQAALLLGRSANAVESLRRKWRTKQLPAGLAEQLPAPPQVQDTQERS